MSNSGRVPVSVYARKYAFIALIAALSAALYCVAFAFLAGGMAENCAEIARCNATSSTEAVFMTSPADGECFYNLNSNFFAFTSRGKKLNCDLIMERSGVTYADNPFYDEGSLNAGGCAVSANLASKFGLKVGDALEIEGVTFKINKILPAQRGIDSEYLHEGVVVFAYDAGLLAKAKNLSYVSFFVDQAFGYKYSVRLSELESAAVSSALWRGAVVILCVAAVAALGEALLFARRRGDYAILKGYGMDELPLFGRVLSDMLLKYVLPLLCVSLGFSSVYACYAAAYFIPVSVCFAAGVVVAVAASVISFIRLKR